jgi:carbon monoxide dehydrogenase subunit G
MPTVTPTGYGHMTAMGIRCRQTHCTSGRHLPVTVAVHSRPMGRIQVQTTINATPEQVWASLEDVATHVQWMADAEAIRFRSDQTSGVGCVFECDTKVGPLRLTDVMEITEWVDGSIMGVRHTGLVTGTGRFELVPDGDAHTTFTWDEKLVFPWWMGGPVGGVVGGVILRQLWKGNLRRLKATVEAR